MNFRSIFASLAVACFGSALSHGEEIVSLKAFTTSYSQILTLQSGENAKLIHLTGNAEFQHTLHVQFDGDGEWRRFDPSVYSLQNFTVVGPAAIRLSNSTSMPAVASFEVNRKADVTVPVASVVIPEDAAGQFQVILESSTDTITWTQAQPGTYGGSTVKRFFRTRIVKVQ